MAGFRRRPHLLHSLVLAVSLLAAPTQAGSAPAYEIGGRVVAVSDGDTLTVLAGAGRLRVRLAEIDAPERGQPYGSRARQSLVALCLDRPARVHAQGHDRYGRVVGHVSCGGVPVNAEQVRRGYAWVYTRYARRDSPLYAVERGARTHRVGLWNEADPLPPWQWRRHRHVGAPARSSSG